MSLFQIILILALLVSTNLISFSCGYAKRIREEIAEKVVKSLKGVKK